MPIKISCIVTIYNSEKYVAECVCSLFEQTLNSIEYIFVNDATPDNSINIIRHIIDNYPKRKSNIKIINLEKNGGVSNARRIGVENATGEYIIHCDSDDWIDNEMYELLYLKAKETNADIVGCNFRHEFSDKKFDFHQQYADNIDENIRRLIDGKIFPSLCTSLTRRSLIEDNGITFPIGMNMGEDLYFNLQLYLHAKSIVGIEWAPYHYRHTENSSCIQRTWESINSDIHIAGMIENVIQRKGLLATYKKEIEFRKFYSKMPLIINFNNTYNYKKWLNIYPETHKLIMNYKQLSLWLRIELWFATHNMFYVSKAIRRTLIILHTIKTRIVTIFSRATPIL